MPLTYYPQHTFVVGLATIRRERRLPPGAIGEATVRNAQRVEAVDTVLKGSVPGAYIIIDAYKPLGLKQPEDFDDRMLQVQPGALTSEGQVIASVGKGRGAKTVKAPEDAIFVRMDKGRIILQANPQTINVQAMCPGEVTSVRSNGEVLIETVGALIQCAWGNDKRAYGAYKLEPAEGLESLRGTSVLNDFRSGAIVMNRPILSRAIFDVSAELEISALVAPSMHADLRETALGQTIPVILTEGFGEQPMAEIVYNLLRDNVGRPAMIDAAEPLRWSANRPEIIIPLPTGGNAPPTPEIDQPLTEGAFVRMTRPPLAGMAGRVRRIVETPRAVENGLRLVGAEVYLASGRTVFVPLANLELLGRAVDTAGGT